MTEISLFAQNESHSDKRNFSGVLMLFHCYWLKISLFAQNEPYMAKLSFSQVYWSILAEIDWKLLFLFKMNHIQLNWAFRVFWSIFAVIDWKLLFFLKMNYIELNWAFQVFWSIFAEIDWKLLFLLIISHVQLNWVFQVLWCFFAEIDWKLESFSWKLPENFSFCSNDPHPAKLSYSGVLKLFPEIVRKLLFLLKWATQLLRKNASKQPKSLV